MNYQTPTPPPFSVFVDQKTSVLSVFDRHRSRRGGGTNLKWETRDTCRDHKVCVLLLGERTLKVSSVPVTEVPPLHTPLVVSFTLPLSGSKVPESGLRGCGTEHSPSMGSPFWATPRNTPDGTRLKVVVDKNKNRMWWRVSLVQIFTGILNDTDPGPVFPRWFFLTRSANRRELVVYKPRVESRDPWGCNGSGEWGVVGKRVVQSLSPKGLVPILFTGIRVVSFKSRVCQDVLPNRFRSENARLPRVRSTDLLSERGRRETGET